MNYNAIVLAGKATDMKCGIQKMIENHKPPKIVILDVPRSNLDYLSYGGIEEIKNGCFFSSKYESGMVLMNSPHFIIFANEEPDTSTMSQDRWVIEEIKKC